MKEKIKESLKSRLLSTKREGMENLLTHMEKIGFYDSPASTQYHGAYKGALAEHSLNVLETAEKLGSSLLNPDEYRKTKDSIIICAVLHDIGKCGDFGKANYLPSLLKSGKQSEKKPYEINKELLYEPHEVRSVKIATKFIELTEDEEFAILMHNGPYGDFRYTIQGRETPLYLLLHSADMWASRVIEKEKK